MIQFLRKRLVAVPLLLVPSIVGCSGTPPASTGALGPAPALDRSTSRSTEASQAPSFDWTDVVSVATAPGARCRLYPDGAPGDAQRSLQVYGAAEGIVRFFPPPASWGRVLTLDCAGADGATALGRVDLDDASTFFREPGLRDPAPAVRTRPPLAGGDPMRASLEELRAAGYPHRPDPVTAPTRYARWLDVVSHPVEQVAPRLVTHPGMSMNNLQSPDNNPPWGTALSCSRASDFPTSGSGKPI